MDSTVVEDAMGGDVEIRMELDESGTGKPVQDNKTNREMLDDPNFAIVCSFLEKFGPLIRLDECPFDDLQGMLENTVVVPEPLVKLHITLLRRVYKNIHPEKWERSLAKFGHSYCSQDGWEIERFGYKKAKLQTKLRILKNLLEAQFDYNVKFKSEVNKLPAGDLRLIPLGRDCEGQVYWYQVDNDANLRVYREDMDDETWEMVASTREEMCELISKLQKGDVKRPEVETVLVDEDSNEKEIETNGILLDTGKLDDEEEMEESEESDSDGAIDDLIADEVDKKLAESDLETTRTYPINDSVKPKKEVEAKANDLSVKRPSKLEDSPKIENHTETDGSKIISENVKNEVKTKLNYSNSGSDINIKPVKQNLVVQADVKVLKSEVESYHNDSSAKISLGEDSKDRISSTDSEVVDTQPALKKLESEIIRKEDSTDKSIKTPSSNIVVTGKTDETGHVQPSIEEPPVTKSSAWVCGITDESHQSADAEKAVGKGVVDSTIVECHIQVIPVPVILSATANQGNHNSDENSVAEGIDSTKDINFAMQTSDTEHAEESSTACQNIHVDEKEQLRSSRCKAEAQETSKSREPTVDNSIISSEKSIETGGVQHNEAPKFLEPSVKIEKHMDTDTDKTTLPGVCTGASSSPNSSIMQEDNQESEKDLTDTSGLLKLSTVAQSSNDAIIDKVKDDKKLSLLSGLVSYGSSSEDEDEEAEKTNNRDTHPSSVKSSDGSSPKKLPIPDLSSERHSCNGTSTEISLKRKASEDIDSVSKISKLEETLPAISVEAVPSNSIVEEAIKKEAMSTVGDGSGATAKASEDKEPLSKISDSKLEETLPVISAKAVALNPIVAEAIEKEVMQIDGGVSGAKASEDVDPVSKISKLEEALPTISSAAQPFNPIVGEAIEEEVMQIVGDGSGAQNEGGNDEILVESGRRGSVGKSNNKSKVGDGETASEPESSNEDSQESVEVPPAPKKRGRKKKVAPVPKPDKPVQVQQQPGERKSGAGRGRPRGMREVAKLGVPPQALVETNGNSDDRPVRASRRIAQIRLKEEEERRQLEEERLAQLKAAQIRKQKRQEEKAKLKGQENVPTKSPGKPSKSKPTTNVDYAPSPSDSEASEEDEGEEYQVEKQKKKRKRRSKNGRHKGGNPWATSSSDEDSEAVEDEEEYHYEEEEEKLVFNESDHEFSPESDLGEDGDAGPSRHARTAKRGEVDKEEETGCMKCSKGDHPEWILLCDKCDKGYHASCLRPQLWVIPEGEWFCPPCQHNMLIDKLNQNLVEFDKLYKRRENEILRKQRLAYVGISLNNVLPDKQEQMEEVGERKHSSRSERKHRRRRILSDEDLSDNDNFIDDKSDGFGSDGRSSNENSEDEPMYRLRARRAAKTFDYKEYDDMINSACRASDDEAEELDVPISSNGEPNGENLEEQPEEAAEVEEEPEHGGKNEAYEKHLQNAEDETDEESLDEKERLRRKELKSSANKKKKRSFRDLDDYTDEDNSDEDFKGSDGEDDEENEEDAAGEEDESEWSGDRDDSDDSIAVRSRDKGKKGKYGRKEEYLDVGTVRRSTRRRKARVSYDESDQEDEDEGGDKWQSGQSEEEEETPSESDDETYGKRKKKKPPPKSTHLTKFFLGASPSKSKKGGSSKKKRRKTDEDDVDRAWSSSGRKKGGEENVERRTRGRKINFKDILDSGESDDDGNIRPKRRISSDDDDEAETSRRLAEEIKAANQREAAMYAAQQKQSTTPSTNKVSSSGPSSDSNSADDPDKVKEPEEKLTKPPLIPTTISTISQPAEVLSKPMKDSKLEQEMALSKPVPAPPIPPALAKALGRNSLKNKTPTVLPPAGPGVKIQPKSHSKKQSKLLPPHPGLPPPPTSSGNSIPLGSLRVVPPVLVPPVSLGSGITALPIPALPSPQNIPPTSKAALLSGIPQSTSSLSQISVAPVTVTTSPSSKKGISASSSLLSSSQMKQSAVTPPISHASSIRPITPQSQQSHGGMSPQGLPQGLPLDISRVPNPTLYQGNPAMRPFHPMWIRNPGPPPYGNAGGPPNSIGKPPPLNSGPFMSQHGPIRPGYPSPPPLRIPNPNTSPLQAFQHFKRDSPHGQGMYRMPPGQHQPVGLPGILAAGLLPHQGPPERFFGGPSPYPPYNILPPHSQSQPPQPLFQSSPFEFRPSEPFKEEAKGNPTGRGSPLTHPLSNLTGHSSKDEPTPSDSEFGGLVSYFSSQRSEEDMES